MNKYGQLAMDHWARTDPQRYQTIADPQSFFADLGEQAETQIQAMAASLAGTDQPGEEYLAKVGRLNMARLRAEEAILTELIWISGPEAPQQPATDSMASTMREIYAADREDEPPLD